MQYATVFVPRQAASSVKLIARCSYTLYAVCTSNCDAWKCCLDVHSFPFVHQRVGLARFCFGFFETLALCRRRYWVFNYTFRRMDVGHIEMRPSSRENDANWILMMMLILCLPFLVNEFDHLTCLKCVLDFYCFENKSHLDEHERPDHSHTSAHSHSSGFNSIKITKM